MPTILITGCSSGFGLETAQLFLSRGWTVVAAMRTPREGVLTTSDRLRLIALDVTDSDSIARAVDAAGPIEALVNNAGVGLLHAFEGASDAMIRDVFATNTLGTMTVTRAFLPQFRERRAGVVVNISSSVTLRPLPLLAVYRASKAAVNAFSESLAAELASFGIRVHVVLPGRAPATAFGSNARARMGVEVPPPYVAMVEQVIARMQQSSEEVTRPEDVADAVWRAVNDPSCPTQVPAGADAIRWAAERASRNKLTG